MQDVLCAFASILFIHNANDHCNTQEVHVHSSCVFEEIDLELFLFSYSRSNVQSSGCLHACFVSVLSFNVGLSTDA